MIINALCRYYDILAPVTEYDLPQSGYSRVKVSFALNISENGELLNVIDLREKDEKSKKMQPVYMTVPEQNGRAGTAPKPYFLCDNCSYVLGFDESKKEEAIKKFEAFKELHNSLLKEADDGYAKAISNFLEKWDPSYAGDNKLIKEWYKDLLGAGNIVFRVDGLFGFAHEQESLKNLWKSRPKETEGQIVSQCLVTGKLGVIQQRHAKIKGVLGLSSDSALVAINSQASNAYDSYGKENAFNSPISEEAVFKYSTALNYLLSSTDNRVQIGDATTVFWAESPKKAYAEIANILFVGSYKREEGDARNVDTEDLIKDILLCVKEGRRISDITDEIDDDTKFYILGLSPNAGRIAVRFVYVNSFGSFVKNIGMHYEDMELEDAPKHIPIWQILNETVPKVLKEKKVSPLLGGAVMRSVILGTAYPYTLYSAILGRIRSEQDDREKKISSINQTRVSIIKAYLRRNARIHKNKEYGEVLTVSLNEGSRNPAYLLGRLFAMLERAQENASGTELNSTIKDRYFSTASASPRSVFPTLIRLSQHHLAKADNSKWIEIKMGEIMDGLTTFPAHLNIEEQGVFVLGYYHQRQSFFKKKEEKVTD